MVILASEFSLSVVFVISDVSLISGVLYVSFRFNDASRVLYVLLGVSSYVA